MKIIQAGMFEPYIRAGGMRHYLELRMYQRWQLLPRWETRGSVQAYINHSRWIAKCPFCDGALSVGIDDPVFFCVDCGMQANGGGPGAPGYAMGVSFPDNWQDIEAVLLLRFNPAHRNWYPGETVARLIDENIEHGDMRP